jgi:protein phosphatase-4 regulatory subunit 3
MMFLKIVTKNCYAEIIRYLEMSRDYLVQIVDEVRNHNINALKFVYEVCSVMREYMEVPSFSVVKINKTVIYEKLNEYGLYEIIEDYLKGYEKGPSRYQPKPVVKKKSSKAKQGYVD